MAASTFLLLSVLLAFHTTQAKLDMLAEPSTIANKPGDKVTLKCALQNLSGPAKLEDFTARWYHGGKVIAEFDDKIVINRPDLSMSMDAIMKGDASLTINSFTTEHAGKYRCHIYYGADYDTKAITLTDSTKPVEEETVELSTCETVLDKKLDKVVAWFGQFETKLDELSKSCPASTQRQSKGAK